MRRRKEDAKKWAEKNKDKTCVYCQRTGRIKGDCRNRQSDMKKAKEKAKPFVDRKQAAAITDDQC